MLLAQGRYWQSTLPKGSETVTFEVLKSALPEELHELREFRIEVPLAKWNLVVKRLHSDRKLLGGLLLDFAKHKDRVSAAVGSDRLLVEFQRVVLDATVALVEEEVLTLTASEPAEG